jgi:hypothetical protein
MRSVMIDMRWIHQRDQDVDVKQLAHQDNSTRS